MTETEAIKKMKQVCSEEIKKTGFLIFFKSDIRFDQTRLLEPWEKTANLWLPEEIRFDEEGVVIDSNGVIGGIHNIKWNEIIATGIKTKIIPREGHDLRLHSLLVATVNAEIIELKIGKIDQYHGLLGHFIEEYKLEYKKNNP